MRLDIAKGLCLVPFAALLVCEGAFASRLGSNLAEVTSTFVGPLAVLADASQSYDPFSTAASRSASKPGKEWEEAGFSSDEVEGDASLLASGNSKPVKATSASAGMLPSIRIPKETVLRLAQSGCRPSGKFVARRGRRPAGIQVFGATALGIGVKDGDVLTEVSSVPVTAVGEVIALVIAARGARQPEIVGRLWRGQRSYSIVVEQPYLLPAESKQTESLAQTGSDGPDRGAHDAVPLELVLGSP